MKYSTFLYIGMMGIKLCKQLTEGCGRTRYLTRDQVEINPMFFFLFFFCTNLFQFFNPIFSTEHLIAHLTILL